MGPGRLRLKRNGTCAATRFRLSAKRTSPFKSSGASVHSTAGSRGVRVSVSNAGYTTFRGSVKSTGYPLHSPVSPSLPLPSVTVCHHISNALYFGSFNELDLIRVLGDGGLRMQQVHENEMAYKEYRVIEKDGRDLKPL